MVHLKKRQLAPSQQDAKPVIVTKRHQCLSLWMTSLKKQQVAPSQRGTVRLIAPIRHRFSGPKWHSLLKRCYHV
ncbi:hypothetical protein HU200_010911 [Digitaria exilis]|uniref:Uncharacterized protein n=1 Tax=Digitaria exilis TaxID=1010633 RepID=A0A835FI42_9POAL|nr:hypothetical protein HU200_010911 [Digitaria exilis]